MKSLELRRISAAHPPLNRQKKFRMHPLTSRDVLSCGAGVSPAEFVAFAARGDARPTPTASRICEFTSQSSAFNRIFNLRQSVESVDKLFSSLRATW